MKLASLIFFGLLFYAHHVGGMYQPLAQPLSSFRYGEAGWLGYALICSLSWIGVVYAYDSKRFGDPDDDTDMRSFFVLLVIVAATPSGWALHDASAVVLLASLYAYFSIQLYRSGRLSMLVFHLCVPFVLVVATAFHSYGIWQKSLISYFVVAATVQHHLVKRGARASAVAATGVVSGNEELATSNLAAVSQCTTASRVS
jgi:hypothetical protein